MKLNLWIVANCLNSLEPIVSVPEDAPAVLIGARSIYVPKCAYVYQKNFDVVVDAGKEGGYLIFENMDSREILEMVQFAFDFYSDWEDMLYEAEKRLDYETIIDKSWAIFKSPLILLDAGNNVMKMSRQYGADDVNKDWKYLLQHHRSSVEVQQFLLENGARHNYYMNEKARIFHFNDPWINGRELSAAIFCKNMQYGRLNIVEKERKLNPGDMLLADILIDHLKIILGQKTDGGQKTDRFASVYTKLLKNDDVSDEELIYWRASSSWNKDKKYRVIVCHISDENVSTIHQRNVENLIRSCFGDIGGVAIIGDNISFLLNDQKEKEEKDKWKQLIEFSVRFHLKAGISLTIRDIGKLHCYYDQALKALDYGMTEKPGEILYYFYDYAVDYILTIQNPELARYACQVDINNLWQKGTRSGGEQIETLDAYLNNERSLVKTAEVLFVHRNTLVYRVKKILETLLCNLDDSYTREYMRISIRIRRLYA